MATIERALDAFDVFYVSTLKKEMNRDEAWRFASTARSKGMNDFNIARIMNVCVNGGRIPITQLGSN